MSQEIKITTVEVQMGRKVVSLTIEQARELKKQLELLFGTAVREVHHDHYLPYRRGWSLDKWQVLCQAKETAARLCLN